MSSVSRHHPLLAPGDVALVTGGARGITAHAAHELAVDGATLVLVGRSAGPTGPESPETVTALEEKALRRVLVELAGRSGQQVDLGAVAERSRAVLADREARMTIASLRATGATVDYRSADLRDEAQVAGLVDGITEDHGRLDVVVHGAGVLDDRLLRDKSPASFDHVFHTKTDSAYLLARHLDPERVRLVALFGSVAGRFGNAGQTDYAAGNEVLAALARRLDAAWPGRVVAMCWGPWAGGGMVTPELERRFRERGVEPITPELGRRLFHDELDRGSHGDAVVVLGRGPWAVHSETVPALPLVRIAREPRSLETVLDPATDRYLDDHRLDGAPVLPAAVAAELMAEAAEMVMPGHRLTELQDLSVLHGVVLDDGPVRLRVTVGPPDSSSAPWSRCEVSLGRMDRPGCSYRATAVLATDVPGLATDHGQWHAEAPAPPTAAAAYAELLFHGPLLRGLDSVTADVAGWVADVHSVPPAHYTPRSPGGAWVLDPSLLDLGPQLAIVHSRVTHGTTTLPVRFATIRRGRATGSTGGLRLWFRVRPGADAGWQVADFEVVDPDGSVRLGVSGLEAAGTAALNRLATAGVAR